MPATQLEPVQVVMGHFSFGPHRFLAEPSRYITILREPIDRVISHYYFVRRDPTHYLYEASQRLNLRDFVVACGTDEPNNDQTRLLAGDCGPGSALARGEELFATAQQHLRENLAVTGLTEDFDRSVLVMKHVFGWRSFPFYARENVSNQRPGTSRIADETLRVIRAYNQPDLKLYQDAQALLAEQVRGYGGALEHELRTFKRLNSMYQRLYIPMRAMLFKQQARPG